MIQLRPPEDDVEVCTVEKILAHRTGINGKPEYLVQWAEYPKGETWEKEENLNNVKD